jgi:emp24/gp25L/p24 family/GOLD
LVLVIHFFLQIHPFSHNRLHRPLQPKIISFPSPPVPQVTSKYGTEETKAAVDYAVYSPNGEVIKSASGVTEEEYGGHANGGYGPWRVCFRVSSGALLRPSVTVNLNYFLINYDEFLSDGFGEEDAPIHHHIDPKDLGTKEQIEDLEHGLLRLDHYLLNVTHEQRYLYSRTVRHLRTAESTLRRTFWYYLAIYSVICLASFSQLVAVRLMFRKSKKQGLII